MSNMKKIVLKMKIEDNESMGKATGTVGRFEGVESFSVYMKEKEKKIMVIGDLDLGSFISKLSKFGSIVSVSAGPFKEEKKDEEKLVIEKKENKEKPATEKKENKKKPATEKKKEKKNVKKPGTEKKEEKEDDGKK